MTPWEENEQRERQEREARAAKQAAMNLVSELGIHPELVEIKPLGTITFKVPAPSEEAGHCTDEVTIQMFEAWAEESEAFPFAVPVIPNIGDNEWWPKLLECVARGSEEVKFPRELAERLQEWIPEGFRTSVVKTEDDEFDF